MNVRVEPLGVDLEVSGGETIMAAAERAGYSWPTTCGGKASCRVCRVEVVAGVENLKPADQLEQEALAIFPAAGARRPLRLACQAVPVGDVIVHKRGVRAVKPSPVPARQAADHG